MPLSHLKFVGRYLALVGAALLLLSPGPVWANEAVDAATQAAGINEAHCADLHSLNIEQSADSYPKVSEAWGRVSQVYEKSGEPYLLYWRGVLAQCLGQSELAINDFQSFVQSQEGLGLFASLVRKAKTRLRRLGSQASAGQGAAANWLRLRDLLEVRISYRGGGGLRSLACIDPVGSPGQGGRVENTACVGSPNRKTVQVPGITPLGVEVGLDLFPVRKASFLGLGARLLLDLAVPSYEYCGQELSGGSDGGATDSPSTYSCTPTHPLPGVDFHGHAPGPITQVYLGPALRVLSSVASGVRAGEWRIEPRFAMAFGRFAPWAGSPKYHNDEDNPVGFLDAGSYALRHFGASLAMSGSVELGAQAIFSVGGEIAVYAPAGADGTPRIADAQPVLKEWFIDDLAAASPVTVVEEVRVMPDVWQSHRLYASGRAALLVPHQKANIAIGPFFQTVFHSSQVVYIDHGSNAWNAGSFQYLRPYRYEELLGHPLLNEHFRVAQGPSIEEGAPLNPGNPASEVQEEGFVRKVHSTRRSDLYFLLGVELRFGVGAIRR